MRYQIIQQTDIDDMQFGFMRVREQLTLFFVRQTQENFRAKGKALFWLCGFEK